MIAEPEINMENEETEEVSKSQRKREADEIRQFAAKLISLGAQKIDKLPLSQTVRDAIAACPPRSTRGAYKRHIQYLGKLLRKSDDIDQLMSQLNNPAPANNPHAELCNQLIEAFTAHAETLREQYPNVSLQQARQLARVAGDVPQLSEDEEPDEQQRTRAKKAQKARKSLLRLLSESEQ